MGEKLSWILKNQSFRLAASGVAAGISLLLFMERGGLLYGFLYAGVLCALYFRPLFNASSVIFLFASALSLSVWAAAAHFFAPVWFSVFFGVLFAVILGIKNLVITRRAAWARGIAYAVIYAALLLFFMQGFSGPFLVSWLLLMAVLSFALPTILSGRAVWLPALVVTQELAWVVSWLPIGFLSSANFVMLAVLFMGDGAEEGRLTFKSLIVFASLVVIILGSSYWTLDAGG